MGFTKAIIADTISKELPMDILSTDFVPKKFDEMIDQKGYAVFWDKALKCPCRSKENGSSNPDCVNCGGLGWFFIERIKTTMLVTGRGQSQKQEDWQETDLSTARISSKGKDRMTYMDRIILAELEAIHNQIIKIKAKKNGDLFSYTTYNPIELQFVYLLDKESKPLMKLSQENFVVDDFEKGILTLNPNNAKTAIIKQKLLDEDEVSISVRYTHNPCYHVTDVIRDAIFGSVRNCRTNQKEEIPLPLSYYAKKAQFIFDNYSLSGVNLVNND
jgi:hypothetical protein